MEMIRPDTRKAQAMKTLEMVTLTAEERSWLAGLSLEGQTEAITILTRLRGSRLPDLKSENLEHESRLWLLRLLDLERMIVRISLRTYSLGVRVIDGKIARFEAQREGAFLLRMVNELPEKAHLLGAHPRARQALQDIELARIEAIFAIKGNCITPRLDAYLMRYVSR